MGRELLSLPDLSAGDLLPLPHLTWPDAAPRRAATLAADTRSLLIRYSERAREPLLPPAAVRSRVEAHARMVAEVFGYLTDARAVLRARLTEWTEAMFGALDAHGDHRPDPFRGLSGLTDPPGWLAGDDLPAWPSTMGTAVAVAERDLGWRRRRRKVDARTWAALVGLAYLWTREAFAAARPGLHAFLDGTGRSDLGHDGLLAGGALLVNQRLVVDGYRNLEGPA